MELGNRAVNQTGNLPTLLHLGYVGLDVPVCIQDICEGKAHQELDKLKEGDFFVEFEEGTVSGVLWYNRLLQKWMCDVWKNGDYVETIIHENRARLFFDVCKFYTDPVEE
jgi:hypothetical protein